MYGSGRGAPSYTAFNYNVIGSRDRGESLIEWYTSIKGGGIRCLRKRP